MIWEKKVPIVLSFLVFLPIDLVRSIKYWQKTRFVPPPSNSGFFQWKLTPIGLKWDTNHTFWVVSDWVTGVLVEKSCPVVPNDPFYLGLGEWGGTDLGMSTPIGGDIWRLEWTTRGHCKPKIWGTKSEEWVRYKSPIFCMGKWGFLAKTHLLGVEKISRGVK